MPNKKINALDVRVAVASDLMLVGDPTTGTAYKSTLATLPLVPYTGATTNVDLGEFELKAGQVEFDQTPTGTAGVGVMRWNDTDGTVDLGLKGGNVTLQVGQEQVMRVVNKTGADLLEAQYRAVRIRLVSEGGAQGQRLAVVLAQGDNDPDSTTTIGLVTETIANNQEGFITISGEVRGINTTGSLQGETWADGDIVYLSPTVAGGLTKVKPIAPNHLLVLGYVVYAHANNGKIFVKVDNGYELGELHDVYIPTPSNNDGIFWNSTNLRYENKTIASALGFTPVPTTRTLTINGTAYDLSADRSWTISGTNIYNANGTLTSARALTLGGFSLDFIGSTHTSRFTSAGRLLLGTTTESTFILDAVGTARVSGNATINGVSVGIGAGGQTSNTAVGSNSLRVNSTGYNNTIAGANSMYDNTTGYENAGLGVNSLRYNISGFRNSAFGVDALFWNDSGSDNTAIGARAGRGAGSTYNTTGTNNIFIGYNSVGELSTESNRTWIGNTSTTSTWVGGSLLVGTRTDNSTDKLQVNGSVLITGVIKETITTNRQTASYSLVLADRGKLVEMNSASANTLTIPLNSSIAFPIGSKIDVTQYGAGATTITATSGVTIRSFTSFLKIAGQYAACTLVKIGTDEWYAYGNLIA
jgi:hypothetical protein